MPEPQQPTEAQQPVSPERRHSTLKLMALLVAALLAGAVTAAGIVMVRLDRNVDAQLATGPFAGTFNYYSAPGDLSMGDATSEADVIDILRRHGFRESSTQQPRSWQETTAGLVVNAPSLQRPVLIRFKDDKIAGISEIGAADQLQRIDLEPALVTNLSGDGHEKRLIVHFRDLPPILVQAVVSAEDKRFFEHDGLDLLRIGKAAFVDIRDRRKEQGASTITMQLARNLYLDSQKRWRRKMAEVLITLHLERTLSKQTIFEDYANQVYLGHRGPFDINGFGEAARAYFNKDVRRLTLPEAATLAGMIQRPSWFDPFRNPDRTLDRRNIVLALMKQNRYITEQQYEAATAAPLGVQPGHADGSSVQYFLDLAADRVHRDLGEDSGHGAANVYTTLDLRLQHAAEQAIADGMKEVDKRIRARKKGASGPLPQVALIALDPHTGAIKALVGGRSYAESQLNRVLAKRPPGSVFKPFVYAAALDTAVSGGPTLFYPASVVVDEPFTFRYAGQTYSPGNFKQEYEGQVTFREALTKSLNVATIKVAEEVGLDRVIAMARRAGIVSDLQPTPALAIGAYGVTPLEIARAWTMFANDGVRTEPRFIDTVSRQDGTELYHAGVQSAMALDPRVNFLMVSMLEDVINRGTAAGARARGFRLPAAGKTGTSHDGWFAGFTSRLLCIVWVGFDDYRDLNLEGAHSALPIWTEFMQEAARYADYRDVHPFKAPSGVVRVNVDPTTGMIATPYCPLQVNDYFVDGSQPADPCTAHTQPQQVAQAPSDGQASQPPTVDTSASATQGTADRAADPASNETSFMRVRTTGEGTKRIIVPQQPASNTADATDPQTQQ